MATSRSLAPTDLGRLAPIDPLTLEPGMIVWERFCVVGKVHHASPIWSVPVTDLAREFGRPPHHRVVLQYLPIVDRAGERVRRAVAADEQVQPRVRATIDLPGALTLVHDPVQGEHLGAQLPAREARALALALSGLLVRLHEAQVRGVSLRVSDLRHSEGQFRLKDFEHLSGAGTREQDVEGLVALLRRVAGHHLGELLEPAPRSSAELWGRARALSQDDGSAVAGTPLSQHPPFVGRERARQALEESFANAQIARSSITVICGAQGAGKTRLLEEFASWLRAEDRAFVVRGEYLHGCGESRGGLAGALGRLPEALANGSVEVRDRVRERLARRMGSRGAVLAAYAPALGELLDEPVPIEAGDVAPSHEAASTEGFARHAVAIADGVRSIGAQDRPLVILLDNLQLADHGSIAVLRQLLLEDRSHHTMIVAGLCGDAPPGLADPEDGRWNPQRDPQLLLERVDVEALRVSELERLIVAGLPGPVARPAEVAETLFASSRGNPLVAWATLQSWIDRGVLVRGEADPWTLRRRKVAGTSPERVFAERVEQTSLDERWLALLAAVAGSHVDEAWFQRVSGWPPRRVAAAVEGLERRGLMGKAGEASLRFPHELVRELVIARTPAGEVRRAHADIAGWLASLGPRVSAARLAYHTDRALGQDSHNDPRLAEMHLAAGREMLGVYDLERSGWHFTRALTEPGQGEHGRDGRLAAVEGAADVALLGGKVDEAAQLYAEAVVETDDPTIASRIAAKAVHGLFRKSAANEAATIGRLALGRAHRPLPEGDFARNLALAEARLNLLRKPERVEGEAAQLAEQLCWLYARLAVVLARIEPGSARLCLLRALRLARTIESPAAANVLALHGAELACDGRHDEARALLDEARAMAEAAGSEWAQGMVAHLRGQFVELAQSSYYQGLASLEKAIGHFRRTGDLSVAVSSLFFKAVYGRDREPLSVLHGWLDEAAALTEVQGDAVVDLGIDALRLYLRARAGARNVVEAAASLSARASDRRLVSFEGYLPHAYLALALLEVGEPTRAREQIDRVDTGALEHRRVPEFACDLWAAIALVLVRTRGARDDRRRFDRALRRLDEASKRAGSRRLAAVAQLVRLRRAMMQGRRDRARASAETLIAGLSEHGQLQLALEAHRTLAELLRGSDVLAAREHVHLARGLARELGLEQAEARERERERELQEDEADDDAPRARTRERSSRARSAAYLRALARSETVEVAEVLEGSRRVLLETVGNVPWVYLRATPELRVHGDLVELQSLLVHLALCARDSVEAPEQLRAVGTLEQLDEAHASKIPGASAGRWGRIAVSVVGELPTAGGVTGGVSACRQVATRMGGFLEVLHESSRLTLAVYLPPEAAGAVAPAVGADASRTVGQANDSGPFAASGSRARSALVLHTDSLVRETLTQAISRLGYSVEHADPEAVDMRSLPEATALFAPAEILDDYGPLLPPTRITVEIGARGLRPTGERPVLRVPFALGELRRVLDES